MHVAAGPEDEVDGELENKLEGELEDALGVGG